MTGAAGQGTAEIPAHTASARAHPDLPLPAATAATAPSPPIAPDSSAAAAWDWHVADQRIVGDFGFATLLGIPLAEVQSGIAPQRLFACIHAPDRDRMWLAFGAMLGGGAPLDQQFRAKSANGAVRWLQAFSIVPPGEPDGAASPAGTNQPALWSGVLVEITGQKRIEERLRIAQTAGGVGIFEHAGGAAAVSVSAQFCALLGLPPATSLPVHAINALVVPGDRLVIEPDAEYRAGTASRVEFRIVRPDTHETAWLTRQGEYLRDAETSTVRFSGVVYDVTRAKRVERELRELNESLESRVAARTRERDRIWLVSPDLLCVSDPDGRLISVNPAWTALLGWEPHEMLGRNTAWLEHEDDRLVTRAGTARIAAGEKALRFENRLRRSTGGYCWLCWVGVRDGEHLYCVARDITAEKATQAELARAQEQLRQSQKMEAVGQLTGGLAHDFNNLLTGIAGSLELLSTRVSQGRLADAERYIAAAQDAARRAAALTHRLLAFSRQQELEPTPTDVNRLIAGMDELICRTMGPEIEVAAEMAPGLWPILVDPNQLENALLNLCINARDAMPDGGKLLIVPTNHTLDAEEAAHRALPPGQFVSLCVSDTGTGMSPEVAARAFDPFFTTKPVGQGTGLGLSMIYGFARQSGGNVHITSEAGRGTTMCIYLPRHEPELAGAMPVLPAAASAEQPGAGPRAHGETVLVVDDDPTIRMLVTEVLEDLGYVAIEAADGARALAVLRSDARIDLLVTDVGLPGGLNGRQVADQGRLVRPGLRVLFMTGYAENAVLEQGYLAQGMDALRKPFAMDMLGGRIKKLIAEGAAVEGRK